MKLTQILATNLSAIIKIAVAIWIVNFLYTKTLAAYDYSFNPDAFFGNLIAKLKS